MTILTVDWLPLCGVSWVLWLCSIVYGSSLDLSHLLAGMLPPSHGPRGLFTSTVQEQRWAKKTGGVGSALSFGAHLKVIDIGVAHTPLLCVVPLALQLQGRLGSAVFLLGNHDPGWTLDILLTKWKRGEVAFWGAAVGALRPCEGGCFITEIV